MDVTEHPAVIATHALVAQFDQLVSNGQLAEQAALAYLASDILGASVAIARDGGPPEVTEHLIELAGLFAVARRTEALVRGFATELEGLDQ